MAVPTRPISGAPTETAWGQVAHDTAVAMDIQAGVFNVVLTNTNQGSTRMTFPRPFASAPVVVATCGPHSSGAGTAYFAQIASADATGADLRLVHDNSTVGTVTLPVSWVAYGPRA